MVRGIVGHSSASRCPTRSAISTRSSRRSSSLPGAYPRSCRAPSHPQVEAERASYSILLCSTLSGHNWPNVRYRYAHCLENAPLDGPAFPFPLNCNVFLIRDKYMFIFYQLRDGWYAKHQIRRRSCKSKVDRDRCLAPSAFPIEASCARAEIARRARAS